MQTWLLLKDPCSKVTLPTELWDLPANGGGGFKLFTNLNGAYEKDRAVCGDERYSAVQDGMLLNRVELQQKHDCDDLCSLVLRLARDGSPDFFNEFRGIFNGVVIDKAAGSARVYHCHFGGNPVFYYAQGDVVIASPDFGAIVAVLRQSKLPYSFDEAAADVFLAFRFMLDGRTHVKEIRRLAPGSFLMCGEGAPVEKRYFMFDNRDAADVSESEAVKILDESFTNAVRRCLEKNTEYGITRHLVDLSGGFDSRILNCTVSKLGYKNIVNVCYSQGDSIDQHASLQMARLLKNEYIYKTLDDASFLYDVDEIVRVNFGLADYSASTGANHLLKYLAASRFGFEHTGLIGDTITGTLNPVPRHVGVEEGLRLQGRELPPGADIGIYPNYDLFVLYTDGFFGMTNSMFVRRQYLEVTSPFLDVEFTSACLSMPMEYRYNHVVYRRWIREKYPEAFKIPSTRCANPGERIRHFAWSQAQKVLRRRANHEKRPNRYFMNPFEHWYATNGDIRRFIREYYEARKDLLAPYPQTLEKAERLFQDGTVVSKLKVLTLLSVLENFF